MRIISFIPLSGVKIKLYQEAGKGHGQEIKCRAGKAQDEASHSMKRQYVRSGPLPSGCQLAANDCVYAHHNELAITRALQVLQL